MIVLTKKDLMMKKLTSALFAFVFSFLLVTTSYAETPKLTTSDAVVAKHAASVNINQADVEALQQIKGIGKKKAQRIVDYRTQNGPFKSIEELTQIKGISLKILEMNKGRLSI